MQESDSEIPFSPGHNVSGNWLTQRNPRPHSLITKKPSPYQAVTKSPYKSPNKSRLRQIVEKNYMDTPNKNEVVSLASSQDIEILPRKKMEQPIPSSPDAQEVSDFINEEKR